MNRERRGRYEPAVQECASEIAHRIACLLMKNWKTGNERMAILFGGR